MKMKGKSRLRDETGQSIVEAALVLPILILILCGIIDFGWIFSNQLMVNNCSREGARHAVVNARSANMSSLVTQKVQDSATIGSGNDLSVSISTSSNGDITVVVTKNLTVLTPLAGVFTQGETIVINSTTVMNSN